MEGRLTCLASLLMQEYTNKCSCPPCRYDQKPEAESVSNRRRVEWVRDVEAGDEFDFVLYPRGSHSCDGMSVIDIIIWPAAASAA